MWSQPDRRRGCLFALGLAAGAVLAAPLLAQESPSAPLASLDKRSRLATHSSLALHSGFLTPPNPGVPLEIALQYIAAERQLLGLLEADLRDFEVRGVVHSRATGATRVYLRQNAYGLPLYNGQLQININREGRIASVHNAFLRDLVGCVNTTLPGLGAREAVANAATSIDVPSRIEAAIAGATLMLLPIEAGEARLVWNFQLATRDSRHHYDFNVDAVTGEIWTRFDWVSDASITAYAAPTEGPHDAIPAPPADARVLVSDVADPIASPLGWHDTGKDAYTIMRGNNVHAYEDSDGDQMPPETEPDCGPELVCDFPLDLNAEPSASVGASVANLFYWTNLVHDVQYHYGFDEEAGNFQVNNFDRGGEEGDAIRAETQDATGCNAGFFTPVDGVAPRMELLICPNSSPARDVSLDAFVVVHEYGHGISTRTLGGPFNSACSGLLQSISEGWSDLLGLVYTARASHTGAEARAFGTWAFGSPMEDIRPFPYSTDLDVNPLIYSDVATLGAPQLHGAVFASAGWDAFWKLVEAHGFDSNLHDSTGGSGNQRMLLYLQEGLANTACNPDFLQARDGILQAAMDNYGGEDVCRLWQAFARRGLGEDAVSDGPLSLTPTDGFAVPVSCFGSEGVVKLAPDPVFCDFRLDVEVIDLDLQSSGETSVTLATSSGDREELELEERSPGGAFVAAIFAIETATDVGNGRLEVVEGDTIRASYFDADDGTGESRFAAESVSVTCSNNLGFEFGDFTSWERRDDPRPALPLQVAGAGVGPGLPAVASSPTEGVFAAVHGFADSAARTIELATELALAPATSSLSFDYRAAWIPLGSGVRIFAVEVQPVGGGRALERSVILEASGINLDTGNLSGEVDIARFAGEAVRLHFEWSSPQSRPGFFQLDNLAIHEDQSDGDLDAAFDQNDNCVEIANPTQCDSNRDGFGNLCDPDLNDDGIVDAADSELVDAMLGSTCSEPSGPCADADLDCDGRVDEADAVLLAEFVGGAPGPSGWHCAGEIPCPRPVPEPGAIAATLAGLLGLGVLRSRRRVLMLPSTD